MELCPRTHNITRSPLKGEDNEYILLRHRAKSEGRHRLRPTAAGVKSQAATEPFSPQIKVNTTASVLKSRQNLVLFILFLKFVEVIWQLMREN